MNKILFLIPTLLFIGCATDGTITAFHPKKPVEIKEENLCGIIENKTFSIDDSGIPPNVGAGKTFNTATHGEVFLKDPISKTLEQKISCRLQKVSDFVDQIDRITVNKVQIGYKNIVVAWETSCSLSISTKLKNGKTKEFTTTEKSASTSFSIGSSMNKVYNNAIDVYLDTL